MTTLNLLPLCIVTEFNIFLGFFQTSNSIYEVVSDLSQRQLSLEDRLAAVNDRLIAIQETLENLPDIILLRLQPARRPSYHQPGTGPSWASISSVNIPASQRRSCTLGLPTVVPRSGSANNWNGSLSEENLKKFEIFQFLWYNVITFLTNAWHLVWMNLLFGTEWKKAGAVFQLRTDCGGCERTALF